ncbi:RICIN domain-containing protein [Saccharothrix sp. S26]|uniref:RICIN domain-containing protein n=1 Tax=Saccharothrix sp. S26 TaxID=2907215 RepID=UPI001F37D3F1|nr:RICIN domain-containing protein [Saccharothrix sp. S26]MCE6998296.1 RICIN domain-containing protein [Saccharothrix sp. S26]
MRSALVLVVGAVAALAPVAPSAQAATVDTAASYVFVARHSGKAMQVQSTADGGAVVQSARVDSPAQQFQFVDSGGGYYRLKSRYSGKVVDVSGSSTANGADVVQWTDKNAANQQFSLVDTDSGYVRIVNRNSGKALDVWERSTADGARVSQYDVNGGTNQQWQLVRLGTTPTDPVPGGCTGTAPITCRYDVTPGHYDVTVRLGSSSRAANTGITAEARRRVLDAVDTGAGQFADRVVTVNVRVPEGQPTGQGGTGTPGLTLVFDGRSPAVSAITVKQVRPPALFLVGDSTVCDQPTAPYTGWGQLLPSRLREGLSVANYADSGESSGSVLSNSALFPAVRSQTRAGDTVMIQVGHNDKQTSATAFRDNLTRMVRDVRAAGGTPVLVTPPVRRLFDSSGRLTGTAWHVNEVGTNLPNEMKAVARAQGTSLIDLTTLSANMVQQLGTTGSQQLFLTREAGDNTHFSEYGAAQMAGLVLTEAVRLGVIGSAQVR